MLSPRPGVVTINSLQARRASTIWGIPNLANRLLQVGLLSSIASMPFSSATIFLAVFISSCVFIWGVLHFQLRIPGLQHRVTLRFTQPFPRLSGVGVIEVSDRRFRERFAECRHAVLPFLFPDHREPLDVGEVPDIELDVFPHRASVPAMETGHIEQQAQFSVLPEESLELRHKVLVICFYQLPADVNSENLPAVFFIKLNGHWGAFGVVFKASRYPCGSRLSTLFRKPFPLLRFGRTPLPIPDFRQVLAVLVDVVLVLDEFVLHHLLQVGALRT